MSTEQDNREATLRYRVEGGNRWRTIFLPFRLVGAFILLLERYGHKVNSPAVEIHSDPSSPYKNSGHLTGDDYRS